MPLGTIGQETPPFFRQGLSAPAKLALCSILALLLMVSDLRWGITQPLRAVLSVFLYPLQLLALAPIQGVRKTADFFTSRDSVQREAALAREKALVQSAKALQVDQLLHENQRLRAMLDIRERRGLSARGAQVIYMAADPYSRKLILDQGALQGLSAGSPVMDELGIVGQITRAHPFVSELTLITDRDHAIPILNTRNGLRGVAYGDSEGSDMLELRYLATNADIQEGDLLSTSGIDGVFPPGLPVARVVKVERRSESIFARILCQPIALTQGVRHVMVISPTGAALPDRPSVESEPLVKRGTRK
ncbi:MAG: rod shape-determining protein MreC [Alphaproteobacteria bacterium]|nr:rod shape-determining protein MreC [Alphaproteobacteria bacterium]